MSVRRLDAVVRGRVQGVGFRDFVRREASLRKLAGYVRNGDDGTSVEVVAEGPEEALAALLAALREGPRFARVDSVDYRYSDAAGAFATFTVTR